MKNSDQAPGDLTSASSTSATEEDVFNEDDSEVVEELEDKQLSSRLENLEQVFYTEFSSKYFQFFYSSLF